MATFAELGVKPWLCEVCKEMGFKAPTEIQKQCIPEVIKGRDVVGAAQTGSGKTAAFALPMLQVLAEDPYGIFALILTPTRELAIQIAEQFRVFGSKMSLRDCVVIGGVDITKQAQQLTQRPHVVIATPGRLLWHIQSTKALNKSNLAHLKYLVLDEADRLLDEGFAAEMDPILEALPPSKQRQTLLFSATMTKSLSEVKSLSANAFHFDTNPSHMATVEKLKQEYIFMPFNVKDVYMVYLLKNCEEDSVIVFTSTCKNCQLISDMFTHLEIPSVALHSMQSQNRRIAALHKFKSGVVNILVATDVASRGLDIPTVKLVVNHNVPKNPKDYIHRVGRTARAGRGGRSVTMVSQYDIELVQSIEEITQKKMEEFEVKETEVLQELTEVTKAKREAALKMDDRGFGAKYEERKKKRKAGQSDDQGGRPQNTKKTKGPKSSKKKGAQNDQ